MRKKSTLLGAALLAGGVLVSIVIIYLVLLYYREGLISLSAGLTGTAVAFLLLVMPQLWLGVYLIRFDHQQNR